jgi:hypothetical protein
MTSTPQDSSTYREIVDEIDRLMSDFSHTKKDIGYGWRRTFDSNSMWFDLIDYKCKGIWILRVGRGARLVKQYPILHGLFDIVSKVIAKFVVPNAGALRDKHMAGIIELLAQAPKGVGAIPT